MNVRNARCVAAFALATVGVIGLTVLSSCQAGSNQGEETSSNASTATSFLSNDSVLVGEYDTYSGDHAASDAGSAIEGSEEDAHQQDLIAGGNAGVVVSQNLSPLSGIASRDRYGEDRGGYMGVPATIPHETDAAHADCASCHESGDGSLPRVPDDHAAAGFGSDQCLNCHVG